MAHLALEWVPSLAQLANRVGTVVLSLPKPEISRAVVTELVQGAKAPELIIETSTITPQVAQNWAPSARQARCASLMPPLPTGVASMAAGKITFLVGGEPDDVARAHPTLEGMAEAIMHLGPVGAGMGAKVVVNAVAHAVMVVLIEAGAMATKLGLPMQTLVDILRRPEGLTRPLTHRVQERMMQGDYSGGMSVSNARKDSTLALQTAQELGYRSTPSRHRIRRMRSPRRSAWASSTTPRWPPCGSSGQTYSLRRRPSNRMQEEVRR